MRTKLFLFSLLFTAFYSVDAQRQAVCGFDLYLEQLRSEEPEHFGEDGMPLTFHDGLVQSETTPEGVVNYIPVVFHIMWTDEEDNVSREQILDGLRVLNEDFRRMNADAAQTRAIFQSVAADAEMEFRLATKDPNGNCHSGIIRKQSTLSANPGNSSNVVKASSNGQGSPSWPNTEYLNIWVVRNVELQGAPSGSILGYAAFPRNPPRASTQDGIVMRHDQLGSIGSAAAPTLPNPSGGRTLTHEVGHYLNLYHPFQGGCNGGGDNVSDTPPVDVSNFGCQLGVNSCNNDSPDLPDQIENYMDYADCPNMFTIGQKTRMTSAILNANLRGNVSNGTNLQNTGAAIDNFDCAPSTYFVADRRLTCEGGTIEFSARAEGGNVQAYSWNFPGGSPASSTAANPTVTYNQAGIYPVSLTLSNPTGSSSETLQSFIKVTSSTTADDNNLSEDFESITDLGSQWSFHGDADYLDFEINNSVGFQSNSSVYIDNFNASKGQFDNFYSKSIDVRFASSLTLRFNYAFATKESSDNDILRLYVSDDCGQSWVLSRIINTTNLNTAGIKTTPFTPANDSEWDEYTVNLNGYAGSTTPIQIRWELSSGGGNNFYMDNINLDAVLSNEEITGNSLRVFPNPTQGSLQIETLNPLADETSMTLIDLSGRQIALEPVKNGLQWKVELPTSLANGVYMLQVNDGSTQFTERIVIEK